jgi:hypothetical protein
MNMMLLPLPVNYIIMKHEFDGMVYGRTSNFKIGMPQPTFINSGLGMLFVWCGLDRSQKVVNIFTENLERFHH